MLWPLYMYTRAGYRCNCEHILHVFYSVVFVWNISVVCFSSWWMEASQEDVLCLCLCLCLSVCVSVCMCVCIFCSCVRTCCVSYHSEYCCKNVILSCIFTSTNDLIFAAVFSEYICCLVQKYVFLSYMFCGWISSDYFSLCFSSLFYLRLAVRVF